MGTKIVHRTDFSTDSQGRLKTICGKILGVDDIYLPCDGSGVWTNLTLCEYCESENENQRGELEGAQK